MTAFINWKDTDKDDEHALWWSSNATVEILLEWILRYDVEAFLPIRYIDDLIRTWGGFYPGAGFWLYHDFQTPRDQTDVVEHFRQGVGRLCKAIKDDAPGVHETLFAPGYLPYLQKLFIELKYQKSLLRSQRRCGTWTSFAFKTDKRIKRWAKVSRTFHFRPGLEWTYRPTWGERVRMLISPAFGIEIPECQNDPMHKRLIEYALIRTGTADCPFRPFMK